MTGREGGEGGRGGERDGRRRVGMREGGREVTYICWRHYHFSNIMKWYKQWSSDSLAF